MARKNGDSVNLDFELFENIMDDVETHKREEEEFFNVSKKTKENTLLAPSPSFSVVENSPAIIDRFGSFHIDGGTPSPSIDSRTPRDQFFPGNSSRAVSNLSMDKFEGGIDINDNDERYSARLQLYEPPPPSDNSKETVVIEVGDSFYRSNSYYIDQNENDDTISGATYEEKMDAHTSSDQNLVISAAANNFQKEEIKESEQDDQGIDSPEQAISSSTRVDNFDDEFSATTTNDSSDTTPRDLQSEHLNETRKTDDDETNGTETNIQTQTEHSTSAQEEHSSALDSPSSKSSQHESAVSYENVFAYKFDIDPRRDSLGTSDPVTKGDENEHILDEVEVKENLKGNENKPSETAVSQEEGEKEEENKTPTSTYKEASNVDEGTKQDDNLLEEIMKITLDDLNAAEGSRNEEENASPTSDHKQQSVAANTEEEPTAVSEDKKLKFERQDDTYDELGDRRYDVHALELVSEDECEYVNLIEVQQGRAELSAFAMSFENFNNIITELERPPEDKKKKEEGKTISFNLDGVSDEEGCTRDGDNYGENTKKTSPKKLRKTRKTKRKNDGLLLNKICKHCKNPISKRDFYPELNELFSDRTSCTTCCAEKKRKSTDAAKSKNTHKTTTQNEQHDNRINKEVKAALDSKLKNSENAALTKWLKEKNKVDKRKKRQERREQKGRARENKEKRIAEQERLKKAQEKVEQWEDRKRREAKEKKKKSNISASLPTNKAKPIIHSQNKHQGNNIYLQVQSPRSDTTFDISEESSFGNSTANDDNLGHRDEAVLVQKHASVESFIQSVISDAVSEMERDNRTKQARLKRPKTHSVAFDAGRVLSHQPAPPPPPTKIGDRQKVKWRNNSGGGKQQYKHAVVNEKLMRSKTYGEWLTDKKVRRNIKSREQEINEHFDKLQERLITIEKERRRALLQIRSKSAGHYSREKLLLPELSTRLEPQGSESSWKNLE